MEDEPLQEDDDPKAPTNAEYGDCFSGSQAEAENIYTEEMFDKYVGAQLIFDRDGERKLGTVIKRAKGFDGKPFGSQHSSNPIFDTRDYVVEFASLLTLLISENMISQVDSEGHDYLLMKEIVDHRSNEAALKIADGYVLCKNGQHRPKITTNGWELCVEWKEGSTDWIKLKDLKESYPVQVAEYAVANKLVEETALKWWVPDVLRKRNRIIAKVKSRYWKTSHKYGIRLPHSAEEALQLDKESGTDYWQRALAREMNNVQVAWKARDDVTPQDVIDGKVPDMIGYKQIKCHIIFDIKMDLTRKARFVAGGHLTDAPQSITYSSVVTRDSVWLAFLIAALNDLCILACDITNAYLNAPFREKIWFVGGIETNYELILVYVDDVLAISETPQVIIDELSKFYVLKEGSVGEPTRYLGADISRYTLEDGRACWRCLRICMLKRQSR